MFDVILLHTCQFELINDCYYYYLQCFVIRRARSTDGRPRGWWNKTRTQNSKSSEFTSVTELCNTILLWHQPSYRKFRSALTRLPGGTDVVVLQSNCVQTTCSRSLHSNCLRRDSNPYSLH